MAALLKTTAGGVRGVGGREGTATTEATGAVDDEALVATAATTASVAAGAVLLLEATSNCRDAGAARGEGELLPLVTGRTGGISTTPGGADGRRGIASKSPGGLERGTCPGGGGTADEARGEGPADLGSGIGGLRGPLSPGGGSTPTGSVTETMPSAGGARGSAGRPALGGGGAHCGLGGGGASTLPAKRKRRAFIFSSVELAVETPSALAFGAALYGAVEGGVSAVSLLNVLDIDVPESAWPFSAVAEVGKVGGSRVLVRGGADTAGAASPAALPTVLPEAPAPSVLAMVLSAFSLNNFSCNSCFFCWSCRF